MTLAGDAIPAALGESILCAAASGACDWGDVLAPRAAEAAVGV